MAELKKNRKRQGMKVDIISLLVSLSVNPGIAIGCKTGGRIAFKVF